jgi:hypothetical protein
MNTDKTSQSSSFACQVASKTADDKIVGDTGVNVRLFHLGLGIHGAHVLNVP